MASLRFPPLVQPASNAFFLSYITDFFCREAAMPSISSTVDATVRRLSATDNSLVPGLGRRQLIGLASALDLDVLLVDSSIINC
jgi:hypothetical protein